MQQSAYNAASPAMPRQKSLNISWSVNERQGKGLCCPQICIERDCCRLKERVCELQRQLFIFSLWILFYVRKMNGGIFEIRVLNGIWDNGVSCRGKRGEKSIVPLAVELRESHIVWELSTRLRRDAFWLWNSFRIFVHESKIMWSLSKKREGTTMANADIAHLDK